MHQVINKKVKELTDKNPCPKDEEKKKGDVILNVETAAKQDDDKKPDEEEEKKKADEIPQWGLELKASLERVLDIVERKQDDEKEPEEDEEKAKKQDDDKEPDEEEKQDDEEKEPDEEKKQDDEEEDEETKKLKTMVQTALEEAGVQINKRGKVPTKKETGEKGLTMEEIFKTSWSKIHKASGYGD